MLEVDLCRHVRRVGAYLQDWEQDRREPNGVAKMLLKVTMAAPKLIRS
jgi:DNA-binding transcriptional regulator YiaG